MAYDSAMPTRLRPRRRRDRGRRPTPKKVWRGKARRAATVILSCIGTFTLAAEAIKPARDLADWISHHVAPPHPDERSQVVNNYVRLTSHALAWVKPPTIYKPSVQIMKARFADFDPYALHPYKIGFGRVRTDLAGLMERAPLLAGVPLTVEGSYVGATLIDSQPRVSSWALQIQDKNAAHALIVCRLPAKADGPPFAPGDWVLVQGVLLADGAATRVDGKGMDRVFYVACTAATRRELIIVGDRTGFRAIAGNEQQPTASLTQR